MRVNSRCRVLSPWARACLAFPVAFGIAAAGEVFHGVALAPEGVNAWVVTIESTSCYHTPDFGANWQSQSINVYRDYFDVFFLDNRKGWVCGRAGGIWHTTDAGDSWYRQNLAGPKFASRIQFVDANHGYVAGGEAIILRTTNGGLEWPMTIFPNPPYPPDTVDFHGISFVDTVHGWLAGGRFPEGDSFKGGQGYIVRLTITGDTVKDVLQRKDTAYDFFDVEFVDTLNGWVVGGDDRTMSGLVLHTSDGGANWAGQTLPVDARVLRAVEFVSPTQGWACGRSGTIIHTTDAGNTWEQQSSGVDTTLFDIDFSGALRGMVAGSGSTVLRTSDGGQTWEKCYSAVVESPPTPESGSGPLLAASSPARGRVAFNIRGLSGDIRISVCDAAGRVVRTLAIRQSPFASRQSVVWDGRDEEGMPVSPGCYVARSGTAGQAARFVLLQE